jgi:spore maturation protein CgeD
MEVFMTKVSVILTSYNRPYFLMQSIASVLNQSSRDFELIICDDNSPDPLVREILNTFEGYDPHVRVYHSEVTEEDRYKTARYATMINHAVRSMAVGKYITYLTDDDIFYHDRLQRGIDMLDANPDYQVVYFNQNVLDLDLGIAGRRQFNDKPMTKAWDAIDHNSIMHRSKLFFDVGGWPEGKGLWGGADAMFFKKINDRGIPFMPIGGEPGDGHRYHEESVQWKIANNCFFPG